jgi:putative heme-binding domain-containing protein
LANALGIKPNEEQLKKLKAAEKLSLDSGLPLEQRLENLALLRFAPFEDRQETLFALLRIDQPTEMQKAAIGQLSDEGSAAVAGKLLEVWKTLGPATRIPASNIFIYRRENQPLLLAALEEGEIPMGQLNLDLERRRAFLFSRDENIKRRAEKLFSDAGVVTRADAMEQMRPALKLTGDFDRGRIQFDNLCAKCHVIGDIGTEVGPGLTDISRKSGETLLHDIIDPNAAVDPEYIGYTVVREDGQILNGLLVGEQETTVTLREAENKETVIPRSAIREMYASGLSLMPEELEKDMKPQDMADLLAFLQHPR